MTLPEVTPRMANIPYAAARKHAGRDEWLFEVLTTCAMTKWMQALRAYDPTRLPSGVASLSAWLWWCVERAVFLKKQLLDRRQSGGLRGRERFLGDAGWVHLAIRVSTPPDDSPDRREAVAALLARLNMTDRALLTAWSRGMSCQAIGDCWGISRQSVRQRLLRCLAALRRTACARKLRGHTPRTSTVTNGRAFPVGTVRLMKHAGRVVRMIKVADSGPNHRRWQPHARYNWERHYGPIPPGMHVHFRDGDPLNDGITNLELRPPGNPKKKPAGWKERAVAGTARANRERARARRLLEESES